MAAHLGNHENQVAGLKKYKHINILKNVLEVNKHPVVVVCVLQRTEDISL